MDKSVVNLKIFPMQSGVMPGRIAIGCIVTERHGAIMKSIPEFPITGVVPPEVRFIKIREVLEICGKSRSSIYAAVQKGDFPSPVKLSERSSAWVKSEVLQWAQKRIDTSREDAELKRMKIGRRRAD